MNAPNPLGLTGRRAFWFAALTTFVVGGILVYAGVLIGARGHPSRSEWMGFAGSIMGAGLSVIGALIVVEWQAITQRKERQKTLRQLLSRLSAAGQAMQGADAVSNPVPRLEEASNAYRAARAVAAELRSTGAGIAEIAQLLEADPVQNEFVRLLVPGIGIAAPDLVARGGEVTELATRALVRLEAL